MIAMETCMKTYIYTVFYDNPHTYSSAAWPHAYQIAIQAASIHHARQEVSSIVVRAISALTRDAGYEPGCRIYANIWDPSGRLLAKTPTYTLTAEDLGL